jgi:hypothetical protein
MWENGGSWSFRHWILLLGRTHGEAKSWLILCCTSMHGVKFSLQPNDDHDIFLTCLDLTRVSSEEPESKELPIWGPASPVCFPDDHRRRQVWAGLTG